MKPAQSRTFTPKRTFTLSALALMLFAVVYQSCITAPDDPAILGDTPVEGKADALTSESTVAIVQSSKAKASDLTTADIRAMVQQAVDLAGGLKGVVQPGSTVVLKPNLVNKIDYTLPGMQGKLLPVEVNGVTTDWRVTKAVVEIVRAINPTGKIYIVEGSAGDTGDVMKHLQYTATYIPDVNGFIRLEADSGTAGKSSPQLVKVSLPQGLIDKEYYLNKIYKEASVVISMPCLKNHWNAVVSGGIKNVGIGATPGNIYGSYRGGYVDHTSIKLHRWIRDFFLARPVTFVIMDGLQGVQNGPTPAYDISQTSDLAQDQKNMRLIVAGRDAVAVDTIESLIMGWNPLSVEYLKLLANDGQGQIDTGYIRVVGKQVDEVRKDFAGTLSKQSYGGAKLTDVTPPSVKVQSASFTGGRLDLALTVDSDTRKIEVYLDGKPAGPIVRTGFSKLAVNVGLTTATSGVVYAYDAALNRTAASFTFANTTTPKRTVVLIYGQTQPGQDMFIRGGIDHTYAASKLGRTCTSTNMECAVPVAHRNLKNATTAPWKNGDTYLDWYGSQAGQPYTAQGSPLDWTTDLWPSSWGAERKVAVDGYGTTPLNTYGQHYWLLDVDMDCSRTVNGWFELKSYISNGPGWEGTISQSGSPYSSQNHFAQCGRINVFQRNTSTVTIADF
jgi:uncharacterized protein (DUF362 family)